MAENPPDDAPVLKAWIDTDGTDDNVHIVVEGEDIVYENVDAHVATLVQNQQYAAQFQRSATTLLGAYEDAVALQDADDDQSEIPDSETIGRSEA